MTTREQGIDWANASGIVGACVRPGGTVLTDRALAHCPLPPGSRILDVGCGAGGTLQYLQRAGNFRLVGIDLAPKSLDLAKSRLGSAWLVGGRAEALPFANACFDALLCECVLSLVEDRGAALREFARVLKPGGFLILSDLFAASCRGQPPPVEQSPITETDLADRLTRLGISLLLWEEHDRLLKEFVARMILTGKPVAQAWRRQGRPDSRISYFLLVARKLEAAFGRLKTRRTAKDERRAVSHDEIESQGVLLRPNPLDPRP